MKPKVCIIGAESWGSALSTAVCKNVIDAGFHERVHIYVFDELVRNNYLSEVMNERHENIKYLPGIKLDHNLIAVNDLIEAALNADILIFATSHDFINSYCNKLAGKVKSTAYALSLLKGLDHIGDGEFGLYSHTIADQLQIPCYSLMCAKNAMEMAQGKLCEITIGCNNAAHAQQLGTLLQTDNCKVFSIDDVEGVELCNTLKDLVALCAGFIDGLRLGDNARVTCLHLGLKEMMRFIKTFNPSTKLCTFFESCGVANSIASSYGDKNVTFAKHFVTMQKTVQEIEMNLLNGRKLLGPLIAAEVFAFLQKEQLQDEFPLFTIIHRICQNEVPPDEIIETLRTHPDLSNLSITALQKEEHAMTLPNSTIILENLADTVPENINEEMVCENRNLPSNFDSLKNQLPHNEYLEFSFEVGSTDTKPEIYNKLKEASMTPRAFLSDSAFKNKRLPELTSTECKKLPDLISSMRFDDMQNLDQQLVMKSEDYGKDSTSKDKQPNLVGLTNLIERHVRPFNDKFKALKVRVKVKVDDPEVKQKNKPQNKKPTQSNANLPQNMKVRKAGTKPDYENSSEKVDNTGEIQEKEVVYKKKEAIDTKGDANNQESSALNAADSEGYVVQEIKDKRTSKKDFKKNKPTTAIDTKGDAYNQESSALNAPDSEGYVVQEIKEKRTSKKDFKKNNETTDVLNLTSEEKTDKVPLQFSTTNNSYYPSNQYIINRNEYSEHKNTESVNTPKILNRESQEGDKKNKMDPSCDTYSEMDKIDEKINDSNEINNVFLSFDMKDLRKSLECHANDSLNDGPAKNKMEMEESNSNKNSLKTFSFESPINNENNLAREAETSHQVDTPNNEKVRENSTETAEFLKNSDHTGSESTFSSITSIGKGRTEDQHGYDKNKNKIKTKTGEYFLEDNTIKEESLDYNRIDSKDNKVEASDKSYHDREHERIDNKTKLKDNQHSTTNSKKEKNENVPFSYCNKNESPEWAWNERIDNKTKLKDNQNSTTNSKKEKNENVSFSYRDKNESPEWAWLFQNEQSDSQQLKSPKDEQKKEYSPKVTNKTDAFRKKSSKKIAEIVNLYSTKDSKEKESLLYDHLPKKTESLENPDNFLDAETFFKNDKYNQMNEEQLTSADFKEREIGLSKKETGPKEDLTSGEFNENMPVSKELTSPNEDLANKEFYEKMPASKKPKGYKRKEITVEKFDKLLDKVKAKLTKRHSEKEQAVEYDGDDPYAEESNVEPRYRLEEDKEGEPVKNKKQSLRPKGYPPLNRRMPIPRPPFDVRDHEYHTLCYRPPPDLLRHTLLPKRKFQVGYQARQVSGACSHVHVTKLPTPHLKLPTTAMRSSVLAVELGLLAAFLAHYKCGRK